MDALQLWHRYNKHLCECPSVGLSLDISRINFDDGFFERMAGPMTRAYEAMKQLEAGAIANPDENRMVGHYWLRTPAKAPQAQISEQIINTLAEVKDFALRVHRGYVTAPDGKKFTDFLLIGIGGSALGPQLTADGLASRRDKMIPHFVDNTDPDGIQRVLEGLGSRLKRTLVLVISKSGGTPETRNGMLEVSAYFAKKGLVFPRQAVAVTQEGSRLDKQAVQEGWLARFPMWDWVGGRTSITSAVGLLPMALQGLDVDEFIDGAAAMDEVTRSTATKKNPAALLALMWHFATNGRGEKDMVILPYKDRLLLFSRYLQQLIMESLGKEKDLAGNVVPGGQGIAVYGNKGSTDQHAYVQQLREGVANFFATFIIVGRDGAKPSGLEVEAGVTSGDYLNGLWQGTRAALYDNGRQSITITIDKFDAHSLGALVALYERAVGFYASLVNINAYHQPGVEAGKKAAAAVLELQLKVAAHMLASPAPASVEEIAQAIGSPDRVETVHHILEHLAANKRGVARKGAKFRGKG